MLACRGVDASDRDSRAPALPEGYKAFAPVAYHTVSRPEPVFIIFLAFVFLGEWPDRAGFLGIFLIAAGAYMLNAGACRAGVLGPVKAALKEPGALLMIIVALIYSVTSTLGKVAIQHSSPLFFGFFYPLVLTVILTAMAAGRGKLSLVASRPGTFLAIG
ncbi:MAG: EamA family transporter, partial [Deltaproteobacteria bacterium]|nr:EamA family transporter [Deltaproteobacteria bacterium]